MTPQRALLPAMLKAGDLLRRNLGRASYTYKGRGNLLTPQDTACERILLRAILKTFPNHDYLTEERAPRRAGSRFVWVIDPLDGTTNYAHGFPIACISAALVKRPAEVLLGAIYDPFRKELFLAERGKGATLNGSRISVSRNSKLERSLLMTGFPYDRGERGRFYVNFYRAFMERCHDVRRLGAAALDLAWIACGRADGFWEFKLKPWDAAAGKLLIEEAGGRVTDFAGRPWRRLSDFGRQTLATNGKVHPSMLRIVSSGMET